RKNMKNETKLINLLVATFIILVFLLQFTYSIESNAGLGSHTPDDFTIEDLENLVNEDNSQGTNNISINTSNTIVSRADASIGIDGVVSNDNDIIELTLDKPRRFRFVYTSDIEKPVIAYLYAETKADTTYLYPIFDKKICEDNYCSFRYYLDLYKPVYTNEIYNLKFIVFDSENLDNYNYSNSKLIRLRFISSKFEINNNNNFNSKEFYTGNISNVSLDNYISNNTNETSNTRETSSSASSSKSASAVKSKAIEILESGEDSVSNINSNSKEISETQINIDQTQVKQLKPVSQIIEDNKDLDIVDITLVDNSILDPNGHVIYNITYNTTKRFLGIPIGKNIENKVVKAYE
ncbi:MAG: hypothetical protein V1824_01460, partial [archaeon]